MLLWVVLAVLAILVLWERLDLWKRSKFVPGPSSTIPYIGNTIQMIISPFQFYENQEKYGPLSWFTAGGKFILFSKSNGITRSVFNNAEGGLRLWLIFGAEKILGKNNMAFLHGPKHLALRRSLLPLFTKRALSTYLETQQRIIHEHLNQWVEDTKNGSQPIRVPARDLNIETSTQVFIGPYMTSKTEREYFTQQYFKMNEGFLCFPVALPGTTLWNAIEARKKLIPILERIVKDSKKSMAAGSSPKCLLDFWMEDYLKDEQPPIDNDEELAYTVLDFLFASQDASTSSLVWCLQLLADNPEVLRRVREEQARVRPNNEYVSNELLGKMTYTHQVVKEVLRYRPPATMVPHIAVEDCKFEDTDGTVHQVNKGSVILPSIWCSSFQGYTDPYKFDPDRFSEERSEHIKFSKSWLVFGAGAHLCMGKEYAVNHLTTFCAILAAQYEWSHIVTKDSEEIVFGPTIFPADGCIAQLRKRVETN